VTTPQAPQQPARRLSLLTLVSRLILAITCLMGGVLTVVGVSAYQARHLLLERGVRLAEAAASQAMGVPVRVGRVSGPWLTGFDLYDVRVYGSARPGAPLVAIAPRVHASYSLLEILKLGKKPIAIDVYAPHLALSRDAKGRLDFQPQVAPASSSAPTSLPNLPRFHVTLHGGEAVWHDQAMPGVHEFRTVVSDLSGAADLVNKTLYFRGGGHEGLAGLSLEGSLHLERLSGRVRALATEVPVARWVNYLAASPFYAATGGTARVETEVSWNPPAGPDVKVRGAVLVHGGQLVAQGVLKPIQSVEARATFDNRLVDIPDIHGTLCGNAFSGKGQVLGIDRPHQTLAFTGGAQHVDLATLVPLVPQLALYKPSGEGFATAVVSGSPEHPVVDAKAQVPVGHVLDQTATAITGDVHYEGNQVQIRGWKAALNGGTVTGDTGFSLDQDPRLTTTAHVDGVDLPATLAAYLKDPVPVSGRLTGDVSVSGTAMAPVATGTVEVLAPRLGGESLGTVRAAIAYDHHELRLVSGKVSGPTGSATVTGQASDAGDFIGQVAVDALDLRLASRLGAGVPLTGMASGSGNVAGNWWHLDRVLGAGRAALGRSAIADQPVDGAEARWTLAGSHLRLADVAVTMASGSVRGQAGVDLVGGPKHSPSVTAEFACDRLDLGQVPPLAAVTQAQIGAVKGILSATGSLQADASGLRVQAETVGDRLEAERIGSIRHFSGPVYLGPHRVTFPEFAIEMGTKSHAALQGSIGFDGPTPSTAVSLSMHDASAKEVLAAVNWQQLLSGTWIGRKLAPSPVQGPKEAIAALPDPIAPDASGSLNLKALVDHWSRHHLEPIQAALAYLGSKQPPWQSVSGRMNLDLAFEGSGSDPEVRVRLGLVDGVAYGHRLRNAHMLTVYRDHHLHVPVLDVIEDAPNGISLQARGVLGTDGVLAVYAQNLDLSAINPFLVPQDLALGGRASCTLLAKGDPSDPRLEISAEALDGSVGPGSAPDNRFAFSQANARATYYRGRLTIDDGRVTTEGKEAHLNGSFPVVASPENNAIDVAMDLQGESLGLISALTHGEILWKGGPGEVTIKLGGTVDAPELSGHVRLDGVTLQERNLKGDIKDIRALATIRTDAIMIQRATAKYGGDTLVGVGQVTLKRFQPDQLRLNLIAQNGALIELTNGLFKGIVQASLDITGPPTHPVIGGTVIAKHGQIDLAALAPAGGTTAAAQAPPMLPVDLNDLVIHLDPRDRITFLGPKDFVTGLAGTRQIEAQLDGDMTVNGLLADPVIRGTVNVRSGTLTVLNDEFSIVSGSLEFLGTGVNSNQSDTFADILPLETSTANQSYLGNTRVNLVASGQVYDYDKNDFPDQRGTDSGAGGQLDVKVTVSGTLQSMERRYECTNIPSLTQDRIEKVLGKEALITELFNNSSNATRQSLVTHEVAGFLSTASRRLLDPWTASVRDFLPLSSLGFEFVSPDQLNQQSNQVLLGLRPSFYTETRPLFSGVSVSARYTFDNVRNIYQVGLSYPFSERLSLQAGIDNRGGLPGSTVAPTFSNLGDVNPSLTLTTRYHF
jgi:hypothetical protein